MIPKDLKKNFLTHSRKIYRYFSQCNLTMFSVQLLCEFSHGFLHFYIFYILHITNNQSLLQNSGHMSNILFNVFIF